MKTGNTLKLITIILIVIALMSATAFAAVCNPSTVEGLSRLTYQE